VTRVDLYPEFLEVLRAAQRLVAGREFFLWRRDDEGDPIQTDLSFKPVLSEKVLERTLDKAACTLCSRRIAYKKNQFAVLNPTEPYLVLIHNDFTGPKAKFYNDSEENAIFEKMIEGVLGFPAAAAVVRELVRCHFSAEETGDETAVANCLRHARSDIEAYAIKGILLVGQAASFIFRDKTELVQKQDIVFEWQGVPTMVCSGPSRLVYMRKKNFSKEQIDGERQKIFNSLRIFREQVIGAA